MVYTTYTHIDTSVYCSMEAVTKETLEIKKLWEGTFHKALETENFIFFCNYEEGDMNGNTIMYSSKPNEDGTLRLIGSNYHIGSDFIRATEEDKHIFISDYVKDSMHLEIEAEMTEVTDSVELIEFDGDDEFTVYVNHEENTFLSVSNKNKSTIVRHRITKEIKDLTQNEKADVLKYRYSNLATDEMQIGLDDMFMHGGFMELIK